MLTIRPDDDIDPMACMVGTCKICGTTVYAKRYQCRRGHMEMLYHECAQCKARSASGAGGSVEMRREPYGPVKT